MAASSAISSSTAAMSSALAAFSLATFSACVSGRPDGGGVIRIPVGKRGVIAHLCAVDEQEGVILAEGIVHESCLVTLTTVVAPF